MSGFGIIGAIQQQANRPYVQLLKGSVDFYSTLDTNQWSPDVVRYEYDFRRNGVSMMEYNFVAANVSGALLDLTTYGRSTVGGTQTYDPVTSSAMAGGVFAARIDGYTYQQDVGEAFSGGFRGLMNDPDTIVRPFGNLGHFTVQNDSRPSVDRTVGRQAGSIWTAPSTDLQTNALLHFSLTGRANGDAVINLDGAEEARDTSASPLASPYTGVTESYYLFGSQSSAGLRNGHATHFWGGGGIDQGQALDLTNGDFDRWRRFYFSAGDVATVEVYGFDAAGNLVEQHTSNAVVE